MFLSTQLLLIILTNRPLLWFYRGTFSKTWCDRLKKLPTCCCPHGKKDSAGVIKLRCWVFRMGAMRGRQSEAEVREERRCYTVCCWLPRGGRGHRPRNVDASL